MIMFDRTQIISNFLISLLFSPYIQEEWLCFKLCEFPPKSYSVKWSYKNFFDDYNQLLSIIYENNFYANKNFEQAARNNQENNEIISNSIIEQKKNFLASSRDMFKKIGNKIGNKVYGLYKNYRNIYFDDELQKVYSIFCIDQETFSKNEKSPFFLSNSLINNSENFRWKINGNEIILKDEKYIKSPFRETILKLSKVKIIYLCILDYLPELI
jgi:hypothetical protein